MTEHRSPKVRVEQILDAARTCFIRDGFFQTKVNDIAKEAGLSKGGIYFHFSSKQEIMQTLVQREYDNAMGYMSEVFDANISLGEKFLKVGEHFAQIFSDFEQSRFMITIGEMALRDDEIAILIKDLQFHYFERISQLLSLAKERGEINNVDTELVAIMLKALIDGIQLNYALGLEVDHERFISTALQIIMDGLVTHNDV